MVYSSADTMDSDAGGIPDSEENGGMYELDHWGGVFWIDGVLQCISLTQPIQAVV